MSEILEQNNENKFWTFIKKMAAAGGTKGRVTGLIGSLFITAIFAVLAFYVFKEPNSEDVYKYYTHQVEGISVSMWVHYPSTAKALRDLFTALFVLNIIATLINIAVFIIWKTTNSQALFEKDWGKRKFTGGVSNSWLNKLISRQSTTQTHYCTNCESHVNAQIVNGKNPTLFNYEYAWIALNCFNIPIISSILVWMNVYRTRNCLMCPTCHVVINDDIDYATQRNARELKKDVNSEYAKTFSRHQAEEDIKNSKYDSINELLTSSTVNDNLEKKSKNNKQTNQTSKTNEDEILLAAQKILEQRKKEENKKK